jgi:poly(glycerol-phosphate) alpha-glucosyltransferase
MSKWPKRFSYTPEMKYAIENCHLDILHGLSIWGYQSLMVNQLNAGTRIPYLVSPHGQIDPWALNYSRQKKQLALSLYARKYLNRASCIHVLSRSELQSVRLFGLKNPVCILPNGTVLPECFPDTKDLQTTFRKQKKKVLLYLGRIHPKKGLLNLVRAWRIADLNHWTLVIAGWSEVGHKTDLKTLAGEIDMAFIDCGELEQNDWNQHVDSNDVLFIGPKHGEQKALCFRNCDAFVLPSYSEGLPLAVLEAWSFSKPVLMTPECNIPEGFENDCAIRVETNVESLVAGLNQLAGMSQADRIKMGLRGRRLVEDRFVWTRIANQMADVYKWVLGGGTAPGCVCFD